MTSVDREFLRRASQIPHHGLGLSVDVYQPELFELLDALERQALAYGYLEVFKAARPALAAVRRRLPGTLLEYHAEGLWVTQPDADTAYPFEQELATAVTHLQTLGCHWMNHECASKQMAGYAFGTYLPPLFSRASAEVTAGHIRLVQERLDRRSPALDGHVPLFLFEIPPLTYFAFGDLPIAEFFRSIADLAPCGLVLDIGHLWTVYRYAGDSQRRGMREFLADFLEVFPLERVVQVHVAGLAEHGAAGRTGGASGSAAASRWIDAHGAPIPEVLFDMLELVLAHPKLRHLKGIALEVDNKAVPLITQEFQGFVERFAWWDRRSRLLQPDRQDEGLPASPADKVESPAAGHRDTSAGRQELLAQYGLYARTIAGGTSAESQSVGLPVLGLEPGALEVYRRDYLPHEILHWGGDLEDMFPATCRELKGAGIARSAFVSYWFREPRLLERPYDFFLLKLDRFVDFIREVLPRAAETAEREAAELKAAYQVACERVPAHDC